MQDKFHTVSTKCVYNTDQNELPCNFDNNTDPQQATATNVE